MDHDHAVQTHAVERYLLKEMTPAERLEFEEHYFDCVVCAEDLRAAARFIDEAKAVWQDEAESPDS